MAEGVNGALIKMGQKGTKGSKAKRAGSRTTPASDTMEIKVIIRHVITVKHPHIAMVVEVRDGKTKIIVKARLSFIRVKRLIIDSSMTNNKDKTGAA